jgi:hypothetical protein
MKLKIEMRVDTVVEAEGKLQELRKSYDVLKFSIVSEA